MDNEAQEQIKNIFRKFNIPSEDILKETFLKLVMDEFISFGLNCASATCLKESNLREQKLPFDWMQTTLSSYIQMLNDMKNNNLDLEICVNPPPKSGRSGNITEIKKYDAWIPHEPNNNADEIKLNYIKYFERLHSILNSKNKNIFIMISEYDKFNNKNIIDTFENFLNKEYPNNNYYFFTINVGTNIEITSNRINIINTRMAGTYDNGKWISGIWQNPVIHFLKKYVKKYVKK